MTTPKIDLLRFLTDYKASEANAKIPSTGIAGQFVHGTTLVVAPLLRRSPRQVQ